MIDIDMICMTRDQTWHGIWQYMTRAGTGHGIWQYMTQDEKITPGGCCYQASTTSTTRIWPLASADLHIFHLCLRIVVKNVGDRLSTTIGVEADWHCDTWNWKSFNQAGEGGGTLLFTPLYHWMGHNKKPVLSKKRPFISIINIARVQNFPDMTILNSLLVFVFLFLSIWWPTVWRVSGLISQSFYQISKVALTHWQRRTKGSCRAARADKKMALSVLSIWPTDCLYVFCLWHNLWANHK